MLIKIFLGLQSVDVVPSGVVVVVVPSLLVVVVVPSGDIVVILEP